MKAETYRITCERIQEDGTQKMPHSSLTMDVEFHEDIFHIMEKMKQMKKLPDESVEPFILGLKLLGETLMRHKKEGLCEEILPHYVKIMQNIKAKP